jgi:hypothetical protein
MIDKIISGGQDGADLAALKFAVKAGIETGGWMPKGFLTASGPKPEYEKLYNIKEHTSPKYQPRTYCNAKCSDGTIRFACDFKSPGELCTLRAINQYKKPHIDVDVLNPIDFSVVKQWIVDYNIKVLNVAGNRAKTCPGIEQFVINYLEKVFQ